MRQTCQRREPIAVEQNLDVLNELADAWFIEEGDADRAWKVVARCIDEERTFPAWVLGYLRQLADNPPVQSEPDQSSSKAYYDPIEVFCTVTAWRRTEGKKPSLLNCFERYINERCSGQGEEETIKTAYYRGLRFAQNEIAFMQAVTDGEFTTSLEKTAWAGLAKSTDL